MQLESAGIDDIIQPTGDGEGAGVDKAAVGSGEPAWLAEGLVLGRVAVAVGDGGPSQEDAAVLDAHLGSGNRPAVVDAAARGFGGSIRRHYCNAQLLGRCAQARVDGRAADQDGIESA